MLYAIKIFLSALVILVATEAAKRNSGLAALILSIPLISMISYSWIYYETQDTAKIADISYQSFWYVLPTLPMFLLLSYLLRNGYSFVLSLALSSLVAAILFSAAQQLISKS